METDGHGIRPRTTYTPECIAPVVYQELIASKPRLGGAQTSLECFGVPDAWRSTEEYAEHKRRQVVALIEAAGVLAFSDGCGFSSR